MDNVRVAVSQQTSLAPLTTNTRLLVSTEGSLRCRLLVRVDEDGSGFQPPGDLACLLDVLAPHAGTETGICVVGASNDFLEVGPWLCGHNGAEGLLLNDAGVVWRVVDDSGLDEVALCCGNVGLAHSELVALGLAVFEEALDTVVLHLVLDGTKKVVAIVGVADLDVLCEVDHLLNELLVDGLVNIDALCGNADLARVLESAHNNLRGDLLDVDVRENDGGIVTAELKGDALQSLRGCLHDLLSCGDGTSERDLRNVGVLAHLSTKLVVTANNLDDTRREDLLSQLDKLQGSVGCEWRGLDDNAVSSHDRRCDLADRQDQREVPWADGCAYTERRVFCVDCLLVILKRLGGNVEGCVVADEAADTADFDSSKLPLRRY